jgi:putative FmdB family regulatory protein
MPTYEYACPDGHFFDKFQRMSDPAEADCPECGQAATRKISGGSGFLFKGDGFYITDYRSDDYRKKAGAESGSTTTETGGSDATGSGSGTSAKGTSDSQTGGAGPSGTGSASSSSPAD